MPSDTRPQHAAPADAPPPVAEPPFAERVRTLLHRGRTGALATSSQKHAGFPFASLMPYGLDARGRPIVLISTMAVHTQNLARDARASLLVTEPGWADDPLAGGRATLVGEVAALPRADYDGARAEYLARHANARYWVDFDDFGFWRMEVADIYYVAGFGAMGWVSADEYRDAAPDPLADVAAGIVAHMNDDHADALVLCCRHFGGVAAEAATMTSIDRMGFRVRARVGERLTGLRINFANDVRTRDEARTAIVAMVKTARAAG
jgi:putative heme iron utilization protein